MAIQLSNYFVSFIDSLGVVQGLLFGIMLMLLNAKKDRPTLFLGLFIILFSLEPLPNILHDLGTLRAHPQLALLPVNFHFLAFPLFYIYVQKISILKNSKPSYWTLWPGILEFVAAVIVFLLPIQAKNVIKDSPYSLVYFVLGLCYSIYIGILILKWLDRHLIEIDQQYSETSGKTLRWAKWFIYASIGFQLLLLVSHFSSSPLIYLYVSVINVILIYWVSYKGIVQHHVTAVIWSEPHRTDSVLGSSDIAPLHPESPNVARNIKQPFMTEADIAETLETVEDYIRNSECYVKEDLTIVDVAEAVNIHPRRISHALNSGPGTNFNNFINAYRVEKAKQLLKSNVVHHLSVEGIGSEVGFHSKTTFYSAFKKFENKTPAQFRNS